MHNHEKITKFLQTTPSFFQWKKVGIKHHHGICTPLFSLHSNNSCGIGEFLDLIPFLDFCKKINFNVLQLLPLNDSGLDSSPYNCISAFALNPIYLSLLSIPEIQNNNRYYKYIKILKRSTLKKSVDYILVYKIKHAILKDYYFSQILLKNKNNIAFEKFKEKSSFWLFPYALFKTLKIKHKWKTIIANFKQISSLSNKYYKEIDFHSYVQYLCYKQMKTVKHYAQKNNILIKGDLPILVSKESCDTWFYKNFFILRYSAGAPPDMYNKKGQNWMFPLYNWKNLKKNDFIWWKKRLKWYSLFYDICRLDHIVGFFRMWSIPSSKEKKGSFIPSKKASSIRQGKEILNMMLKTTQMLLIGEDLGIVPNYVKEEILKQGICGTKIIRWERNWTTDGSFIPYNKYPNISLTSVSTHDSDTIHQWWKKSPKEAKIFSTFKKWSYQSTLCLQKHKEILKDSHHTASFFHINLIQEYLALIPDFVSQNHSKERINVPGVISKNNWSYRCIPSIETLLKHKQLQSIINSLI